jgi:uncharacterized membrane protein
LELRIPAKLDSQFVDTALEFYAMVTDADGMDRIGLLGAEYGKSAIPLTRIVEAGDHSIQRLELTARGRVALEIVVGERYLEIGDGDPVTLRVDLLNSGTLRVSHVRMDIAAPLGWDFVMVPDEIAVLMPGERVSMTLALTPFEAAEGVSEYDIRLFAQATGRRDEKIEAAEEDIVIRIEPRAAVFRSAFIIAAMLCLVIFLVVVTIKSSRR